MRILLAALFGIISLNAQSQCSSGCDRTDPADANLTVAANEVVCITASKVFGTIAISQGFIGISANGGELRVCGVGTVLEATSSFTIYPDVPSFWNGGVLKLFNCGRVIQTGSFSDNYEIGIEAYCNDCGTSDYVLDTAVQVTGSKVITGWNCTQVLPVELVDFSLYNNDGDVTLIWTTASEVENDFFEVEYSTDGVTWNSLGVVQGAGNSTESIYYSYNDFDEKGAIRYYRLKQVDFDGTSSYSDVKVVRFNDTEFFTVYQQDNNVMVELDLVGQSVIQVYDVNGRLVTGSRFLNATESGMSRVSISKGNLSAGVYTVNVYNGGEIISKKFIISQ